MAKRRPKGLIYKRKPLEDRFWAKVDKRGPDECWEWIASRHVYGHGKLGEGGRYGRSLKASRVSWEIHNGSIPEGMAVLHKCDNPPCVNPRHLFLGTQLDNIDDMYAKMRHAHGNEHHQAKLTDVVVRHIRQRYASGRESVRSLAREFGVSPALVSKIILNKVWKHI